MVRSTDFNFSCTSKLRLLVARMRYLIDGMGVAAWLFWEFFHARWKILFLCGGDTQGRREMRIVMQGEKYLHEVTLWVVKGHLAMQDGHKVRFEKSSCMHLAWELWCGGGDTWPCKMDVRWDFKSHLTCISHEKYPNRCYLFNVPRPNEEYLQDFPYILFKYHLTWMRGDTWSHYMDARWDLKSHLVWTSHENFAIRCYLFDVPRPNDEDLQDFPLLYLSNVISHGCEVRFEKSSCVHLTWELWCAWSC